MILGGATDLGALLSSLVEADRDAIIVVDKRGSTSLRDATIIYTNAAVERLGLGDRAALIGKPLAVFAPADADANSAWTFARKAGPPLTLDVATHDFTAADGSGTFASIVLREQHDSYRAYFENNPHPSWVYDLETLATVAVNEAALRRYGYTRAEFLRLTADDIRPADGVDRLADWLARYPTSPVHGAVSKHRTKDGTVFDVEIHSVPIEWNGRRARLVTANDISERLELLGELRRSEDMLTGAQRAVYLGSFDFDFRSQAMNCSDELYAIFGLPQRPALTGLEDLLRRVHPEDADYVRRTIREATQRASRYVVDHRILRGDGMIRWVSQRGHCAADAEGKATRLLGTVQDVTERKQAEDQLAFLAHHDGLTHLPNRNLLADRLSQTLAHAQRNKRLAAVLFCDLDNFKRINDTLGHTAGDRLLKAVAVRLRTAVRAGDIVARPSGDEFVIVLADVARVDVVAKLAQKIINAFARPFETDDGELLVSTSMGVSIYPHDGDEVETLIRHADTAMYKAKEHGRNNFQFFTPDMHATAMGRLTLENDLRRALGRGELELYFQPIVDVETRRTVGAEALIRWNHPTRGLLHPADFIGLADETGLGLALGDWVVRSACAQAAGWQAVGPNQIRICVNLSPRQFAQPKLIGSVADALLETTLLPHLLEFEIAESAIAKDPDASDRILEHLRSLGVRLSLDDFGASGFGLERLKRHPVDTFKIGRACTREVDSSDADAAIAASIVTLAHGLRRRVVAVGVESPGQIAMLNRLRCDEMQGFALSQPLCAEDFRRLLEAERSTHA